MIGSRFGYYASQKSVAPSLLLDLYPSNTVLAQSVRKLRTAYAGNAEEVRVNTGGQPQFNIGFNGEDLDEAALVANANGNDAFITNWYDQEDSNNFLQSTASRQPQVVNAGAIIKDGGKPTIEFGNGGLATSSAVDLGGANELWLFMVINITDVATTQVLYETSPTNVTNAGSVAVAIAGGVMFIGQNSGSNRVVLRATPQTGLQILTIRYKSNQSDLDTADVWFNGSVQTLTIQGSGDSPTTYADYKHFIGARNETDFPFLGNISEVILKTGDQSANRAGIEANMAAYYGITI